MTYIHVPSELDLLVVGGCGLGYPVAGGCVAEDDVVEGAGGKLDAGMVSVGGTVVGECVSVTS